MSKLICLMGESGAGKTTSLRNLPPNETIFIDADGKGLAWKGCHLEEHESLVIR